MYTWFAWWQLVTQRAAIVITGNATVIPRVHYSEHWHISPLTQKLYNAWNLHIRDTLSTSNMKNPPLSYDETKAVTFLTLPRAQSCSCYVCSHCGFSLMCLLQILICDHSLKARTAVFLVGPASTRLHDCAYSLQTLDVLPPSLWCSWFLLLILYLVIYPACQSLIAVVSCLLEL